MVKRDVITEVENVDSVTIERARVHFTGASNIHGV